MAEEPFSLDADDPPDEQVEQREDETGLSQNPEAIRARERRKEGKPGRRKKKPSTPRRPRVPTGGEITSRLRESIAALADALSERDPELSGVLRRDGPKMADLLGKWGDHPKTPPPLKVAVVVVAEVLEPLRAFGATVRILLRRFRERRQREPVPEPGDAEQHEEIDWTLREPGADDDVTPPEPPERFRVGSEPPEVN